MRRFDLCRWIGGGDPSESDSSGSVAAERADTLDHLTPGWPCRRDGAGG